MSLAPYILRAILLYNYSELTAPARMNFRHFDSDLAHYFLSAGRSALVSDIK